MRNQRMLVALGVVAVLVLVRWVVLPQFQLRRAARLARVAALAHDSAMVTDDTTRSIYIDAAVLRRVFGESLAVVQRRAMQAGQRADAVDHALTLERVARVRLEARVRGMHASAVSETVWVGTADSVRHATFDVRQPPYYLHANISLPRAVEQATMDARIELDTVRLELRVGCGKRNAAGVAPAAVTVASPSWAAVQLGTVEQAPSVCSPLQSAGAARQSVLRALAQRLGVSVGYAVTRQPGGVVVAGPAIAVGLKVWP